MSKSKKEFLKDAEKIQKDILSLSKKATQKEIFFLNKNEKHSAAHSISHSSHKSNEQMEYDQQILPQVPWTIEQEEYDDVIAEWQEFYIDYKAFREISDIQLAIGLLRKDLHKTNLFFHFVIRTVAIKWACAKLSNNSMDPMNIDIIKHEIECIRAFHHFLQSLFTKVFPQEMPDLNNALQTDMQRKYKKLPDLLQFLSFDQTTFYAYSSDELMERSWKAIETLEVVFQSTSESIFVGDKIASLEEEKLWKLNEKDAFLQEREKYVLSTSLLRAENKKYASISCCFLLIIPIVVSYNLEIGGMQLSDIPFYRAFFVLSFYLSCLSMCLWIWSAYKINYKLILETPYQKAKPVFWTSIGNLLAVVGSLYALYDPTFLSKHTTRCMLVLVAVTLVVFGYAFILKKLGKMIHDLSRGVAEFRSTFLIDQINSLSLAFSDFEYCICYHVLLQSEHYCMDSKRLTRGFLLAACPYFLRLTATMIQIFTKHSQLPIYKRPALVNASKYMLVILAMWMKYEKHFNPSLEVTWLAVQVSASMFNLYWDTVHDWGLTFRIHNESKQIFKKKWVYNLGFIMNLFLRFFWFLSSNSFCKQLLLLDRLDGYELAGVSSMCEVLRRNIWNIFTLEYHQVKINEENFVVYKMETVKIVSEEKILTSDNAEAKRILVEIASITKKVTKKEVKDYAKLVKDHLQQAIKGQKEINEGDSKIQISPKGGHKSTRNTQNITDRTYQSQQVNNTKSSFYDVKKKQTKKQQ